MHSKLSDKLKSAGDPLEAPVTAVVTTPDSFDDDPPQRVDLVENNITTGETLANAIEQDDVTIVRRIFSQKELSITVEPDLKFLNQSIFYALRSNAPNVAKYFSELIAIINSSVENSMEPPYLVMIITSHHHWSRTV